MKTEIYTDGTYTTNNPNYHVEDSAWKAQQVRSLLGGNLHAFDTVVEVGCGAGEILRQLQSDIPTAEFVGYDINPDAISLAQERANNRLHFRCADFFDHAHAKWDLLLLMDVFEHVEDYIGFLKKLKPTARHFVFHIPLDLSVLNLARGGILNRKRDAYGHLHYFNKETAIATLEHAGFKVKAFAYTGSGIDKSFGMLNRLMKPLRIVGRRISPDATARVLGGFSLLVWAE